MDNLTHLVTGGIGYRLIKLETFKIDGSTKYALIFLIASLFPDVDSIARLWGIEAYIIHHRGMTHSVLFAVIFSMLVSFILSLSKEKTSFKGKVFILFFLGMTIHIFMDIITSYGTQILWPITNYRFRLDWLFIVDPIYTLVLLILFLATFMFKEHKKKLALLSLSWIFFYPILCGALKEGYTYWLNSKTLANPVKVELLPDFLTPFRWKIIKREQKIYHVGQLKIPEGELVFLDKTFDVFEPAKLENFDMPKDFMKTYLWFAVYPYQRIHEENGKIKIVEIGDLRFLSTWNKARKHIPFSIFVMFDNHQKPLSIRYGSPSGPVIY